MGFLGYNSYNILLLYTGLCRSYNYFSHLKKTDTEERGTSGQFLIGHNLNTDEILQQLNT